MKLYELASAYDDFLMAVKNGDLPEEAIADTLESIEADITEKVDSIACMLKVLEAEEKAIKEEEDHLAERRKVKANAKNRLKAYLSDMLLAMGKTDFETARNKITFRKTPGKVVVADESAFIGWALENDESLINYGKASLNKTAIKQAIESGREFDGVEIVVSQSMQLK